MQISSGLVSLTIAEQPDQRTECAVELGAARRIAREGPRPHPGDELVAGRQRLTGLRVELDDLLLDLLLLKLQALL